MKEDDLKVRQDLGETNSRMETNREQAETIQFLGGGDRGEQECT